MPQPPGRLRVVKSKLFRKRTVIYLTNPYERLLDYSRPFVLFRLLCNSKQFSNDSVGTYILPFYGEYIQGTIP